MLKPVEKIPRDHVYGIVIFGVAIACLIIFQGNAFLAMVAPKKHEPILISPPRTQPRTVPDPPSPQPYTTRPSTKTPKAPAGNTPVVKKPDYNPKPYIGAKLYRGCKGREVEALQKILAGKGYYHGDVDGKFGPMLSKSVKRFQADHGLEADGVVGSQTRKLLNQ